MITKQSELFYRHMFSLYSLLDSRIGCMNYMYMYLGCLLVTQAQRIDLQQFCNIIGFLIDWLQTITSDPRSFFLDMTEVFLETYFVVIWKPRLKNFYCETSNNWLINKICVMANLELTGQIDEWLIPRGKASENLLI